MTTNRNELLEKTKERALDYLFGGLPLLTDILRPHLTYETAYDTAKWAELIEKAADDGVITNEAQLMVIDIGIKTIMQRFDNFAAMVDKYPKVVDAMTKWEQSTDPSPPNPRSRTPITIARSATRNGVHDD